ncbi:aminoimidazole riboside kinase [Vibrio vulnificus]|uniref:aminoimidazole riboside kinase n=1 Tax=Vibrio vulnificus TaxID=672 RepID=UPI0019D482B3|nr:aminoimidazole riboside kinase [Vibrio vulnificus]ELM6649362.1 aminoimidazole riboside kinase [Vibrio vulnificus]MBN8114073.1 aminoimidazole riboside kinase [Vibrio vulnificus]MCG6287092.1 aminoimidazole riboside kinase [Vibrio vulnificus]MCG6302043.1 aminoimidazole riboside kinase [Vibrio vulnificus]
MNKVWLTGDAVVDLIPESDHSYLKCPGGAPANVAVGIARLAGDCGFFGRVGADPMGRFMKETLGNENVDVSYLKLDPQQRTSTVIIELDDHGERSFTFMVKPSADQFIQAEDIPRFQPNEWIHCCSIALANEPSRSTTLFAMRAMKSAGGFVSFDPNLREEVWKQPQEIRSVVMSAIQLADVVKFSEEELLYLTKTSRIDEGLVALSHYALPLVVVTLGEKGALVLFQGEQTLVGSISVQVVDTTGAGDAFVSGLLAMLSQHNQWQQSSIVQQAVRWGNVCGALATTQKGAMSALPNQAQLLDCLHSDNVKPTRAKK